MRTTSFLKGGVIDAIGYRGWIQIKGAVPPGGQMLPSYQANCKFFRGIFDV